MLHHDVITIVAICTIVASDHNCRNTNHNCRKKHSCCNPAQPQLFVATPITNVAILFIFLLFLQWKVLLCALNSR